MNEKLLKPYSPKDTEKRIYSAWEESGFFNPDVCVEKGITEPDAEPFSIVLPPPNVTGTLHLGHTFEHTMEDIVVRFNRMRGKRTLWIPGTDHAAIATQSKVEKLLEKEGVRKTDLGREEFLKKVEAFAQQSHDSIVGQCKELGTSLDWSREAFTLDDDRSLAVRTAFKRMYDDGLIYRGHRIVNWDPKGQTVISDDEIVYEERKAILYTFKYSKDFPISISTTRPETKVGDTAVAVHPEDERYAQYVGKEYDIVFCGVLIHIKIVADMSVEKEFGTGALGVTPAHSQIDAEIATRHNLPTKQVINEYAKMMVGEENLLGKKTTEAREIIAEWLRSEGLMEKEEEVGQNVSTAERTGGIIEPLPKLQWFINVNKPIVSRGNKSLKELMLEPVRSGAIAVLPDRFENVYYNWVENLRDWCISRQIWYGHRIPVWYCLHCKKEETTVDINRTVYFVRHGLTDSNKLSIVQGHTDIPLNDEGRTQAQEAAKKLKDLKIDYIVSSDLSRAKETAEIIQAQIGGTLVTTAKLRERSYGDAEGMPSAEAREKYPEMRIYDSTVPNGESYQQVEERVFSELENILSSLEGNIVIVSHGGVMRTILRRVKNIDPTDIMAIPAVKNAEIIPVLVSKVPCTNCGMHFFEQDEDTLDTWFSSGLWTFSTLGWPNETTDLKTYHPTSLIMPGYEILFFWVARMILMSQYLLGEVPFKTVYLHGIVRDPKTGKKFSKSAANGVDPIDMINKYGADALRMAMVVGVAPGNDLKFDEQSVKAYGKFANKLWNIARFVLENTQKVENRKLTVESLDQDDKETIEEFEALLKEISKEMEEYKFYLVAEKLYHFVWHTFADVVIERSKKKIIESETSGDTTHADSARATVYYLLSTTLKTLHPFMPYITEELWALSGHDTMLIVEKWPVLD